MKSTMDTACPGARPDAMIRAEDALGAFMLDGIPLARAMAISVGAHDGESLTLHAPLGPNINDKGCAFGGSLASVMTLAGWGLVKLAADARSIACEIYVQDTLVRYLAPVWEDFHATAHLTHGDTLAGFFEALTTRGKGRVRVRSVVPLADGSAAATLDARFVALAKR
ncbi:MAG: YiiD C-terminal domain-containing protein [Dokdonella sp.]|uniref:YiiD C-terminal domain-containing protein n=1 Tax=Dokdonella sp. TaxID=2291710 RepID=UPI0032662337